MVAALKAKCKSIGTRSLLTRVLIGGISGWLTQGDQFVLSSDKFPHDVHRLIRHQNEVGRRHVFLGRFCFEWSHLQDEFYSRTLEPRGKNAWTGTRWQVSIIGEMWDQWRLFWNLRNQELHGATVSQQAIAEVRNIQRDLRDIYDKKALMEPNVQELLYSDMNAHVDKPPWFNRNWLAIHGPLAKASIKRARDKAIHGVKSIRQYFSQR